MEQSDERRHLVQTSINVYADQIDALEDSDANLSGLVRVLLDELDAHDDLTTEELEGLLAELHYYRSRCRTYERILEEELEGKNASSLSDIADEAGDES